MIKMLPGMLAIGAIVTSTFVLALFLVNGTASATNGRVSLSAAERQAAIDYRKAHAKCHLDLAANRKSCVIDAHAAEDLARSAARAKRSHGETLARIERMLDAADRDGIILEPACDVVTREQRASCEIQVGRKRDNNAVG